MADHAEAVHEHPNYVKIWAILLVLLCISIGGPFLGIRVVTLITAFGIAIVKAYMVAKNFMHLNVERRYVIYLILTMVVFVLLFFAGTSPDVMKWQGDNWVKPFVAQASSAPHEGEGHQVHEASHQE
jgi:caa(3)-type oxidase subunit IV